MVRVGPVSGAPQTARDKPGSAAAGGPGDKGLARRVPGNRPGQQLLEPDVQDDVEVAATHLLDEEARLAGLSGCAS